MRLEARTKERLLSYEKEAKRLCSASRGWAAGAVTSHGSKVFFAAFLVTPKPHKRKTYLKKQNKRKNFFL
jgi:hypothetical protein